MSQYLALSFFLLICKSQIYIYILFNILLCRLLLLLLCMSQYVALSFLALLCMSQCVALSSSLFLLLRESQYLVQSSSPSHERYVSISCSVFFSFSYSVCLLHEFRPNGIPLQLHVSQCSAWQRNARRASHSTVKSNPVDVRTVQK